MRAHQSQASSIIEYLEPRRLFVTLQSDQSLEDFISSVGEVDTFDIQAEQDQSLLISAAARSVAFSARISVLDPHGVQVGSSSESHNEAFIEVIPAVTGTYRIRVDSGTPFLTGKYRLTVAQLPGAQFSAPDAGLIQSGQTLEGFIGEGDLDVFVFEASQGKRIELSAEIARPASEPRIDLFDSAGVRIATQKALTEATLILPSAPMSGNYFAVLRDTLFSANEERYQFSIKVSDPPPPPQPTPTTDPDDTIAEATATAGGAVVNPISFPGDVDVYAFQVSTPGQRLGFDVDINLANGLDEQDFESYLRLFDGAGNQLAVGAARTVAPDEAADALHFYDSYIGHTFAQPGTYYLGISSALNTLYNPVTGFGDNTRNLISTGTYTLNIAPEVSLPPRRHFLETTATFNGGEIPVTLRRVSGGTTAIDIALDTWIVIHGRKSSPDEFIDLAKQIDRMPDTQVLMLDWRQGADDGFEFPGINGGEGWIQPVGQEVAELLTGYGFVGSKLHLVGHSWGSYVADEMAEAVARLGKAGGTLGVSTIVALDPAQNTTDPGGYDPEDPSVVSFQDHSDFSWAFHCNGKLALGNPYGNAKTARTAKEAFVVNGADHFTIDELFAHMLGVTNPVNEAFLFQRLANHEPHDWLFDSYNQDGQRSPDLEFEAVITTAWGGTQTRQLDYVSAAGEQAKHAAVPNDFDGDGLPDILWRNPLDGRNAIWFTRAVGESVSNAVGLIPTAAANWLIGGNADLSGDGKSDILWQNPLTGQSAVWLMDGATRTGVQMLPASAPSSPWRMVGAADINGDGSPDILWRNSVTGANACWLMDGILRSSVVMLSSAATQWQLAGASDMNNDGRPDLLWRNPSTGQNAVWLMDGTVRTGVVFLDVANNTSWRLAGAGDYDGDGDMDLRWFNTSTGQRAIWLLEDMDRESVKFLATGIPTWEMAIG